MNATELLSIINTFLFIALSIGGILAYRKGFSQAAAEIQERVINALKSEIDTLKDHISKIEKENARLTSVIAAIRVVLKQRDLHITIDGETVTISDQHSSTTHATRINGGE